MADGDQRIDERLVLGGQLHVQRFHIAVPVRLGPRAGDRGSDQTVVQHPRDGEGHRIGATGAGIVGDPAGQLDRFGSPFDVEEALVAAAGAGIGIGHGIGLILAGQDPARQRAVRDDAGSVVVRSGQLLVLGHAVEDVVERLAGNRAIDAELVCQVRDFGDPPAAKVGDAEVAQLALLDEVADGAHAFAQRRIEGGAVEIEDVDVVQPQPAQAVVNALDDPLARLALLIGAGAARVGELGSEDPVRALRLDAAPDDLLGGALGVAICGVDEVDALFARGVDDAVRGGLVGGAAKGHRPKRQWRDFQRGAAEIAIVNHAKFLSGRRVQA